MKIWFTPASVAENTAAVRYVRSALQRSPAQGYALACEALAAADLRPLTGKIVAPTLVICGDDDIPSFLESARWLAANIKGAQLKWLAGAKHASALERPDQAVAILRNFLLQHD